MDTNHEYIEETRDLKESAEKSFLELGRRLNNIRKNKMYQGEYDTYNDFLRDIDVQPSKASSLGSIYAKFIEEYQFNPIDIAIIGWAKMSDLLNVVNTKEEAQEWIEKAKVLTRSDLRKEVQEAKGKKINDDPKRLIKIRDLVRWRNDLKNIGHEVADEISEYLNEQEE